jgi:hypothetical protein
MFPLRGKENFIEIVVYRHFAPTGQESSNIEPQTSNADACGLHPDRLGTSNIKHQTSNFKQ